jgi:hypothetical protein
MAKQRKTRLTYGQGNAWLPWILAQIKLKDRIK